MILFATQNFLPDIGVTQIYVTGLADALARRRHEIAVYCDASSTGAARKVDEVCTYPINRFGGLRPLLRWRKARAVAARISKGSVRAIVTDTWKSLELLPPRTLAHTRVFCLAHGSEFLARPGSIKERRMIACLAKADIIAANSHFTANLAKPFIGGKTELRVIPPGVEPLTGATRTFTPRAAKGGGRILTIARLEPRKGIDMVLQAIPALQRTHPDIVYDIIGKGADKARLAALAEKLGIANRVHFYGHIAEAEKAALLAAANVFALPNRREPDSVEGFGIVFLEAAAFGVPSLAGTDGGTADAMLEGQTGLLVDGADGAAVQSALLKMPDNSGTAIRLGRAAHQRFWSNFAWDAAIKHFEAALFDKMPP